MTEPVIQSAAGENKNVAAWAISSGPQVSVAPYQPGLVTEKARPRAQGHTSLALSSQRYLRFDVGALGRETRHAFCITDRPGGDDVAAHAPGSFFHRQRLAQGIHTRLRRSDMGLERYAPVMQRRRDMDVTALGLAQVLECRFDRVICA
jgi:hypothetical protein